MTQHDDSLDPNDVTWMQINPDNQTVVLRRGETITIKHPPTQIRVMRLASTSKSYVSVPCPHCGTSIREKKLSKHINERCPKTRANKHLCPICHESIFIHEMDQHLTECQRRHQQQAARERKQAKEALKLQQEPTAKTALTPAPSPVGNPQQNPTPGRVPCPTCGIEIKPQRLAKHAQVCPKAVMHCEYCSEPVVRHTYPKHLTTCKKKTASVQERQAALQAMSRTQYQATPKKQVCPICGEHIPVDIFVDHKHRCGSHGSSSPDQTSSQQHKKTVSLPSTEKQHTGLSPSRTGVFYDDESFEVLYNDQVIGNVGNAKEGWERIRDHEQRIKQSTKKQ